MAVPNDFARQLKSSIDIVAVIGERVPLKKQGRSSYVGLCPFHQEKSGSFHVHQENQFYKCFGCGAGGDVIQFVMEYDGVPFLEAITWLAERYGIPMPKREAPDDPETRLRAELFAMHELAARQFEDNLRGSGGESAQSYLGGRGVSPELAAEFRLGLAPRGGALARLLRAQRFSEQALEASGLVRRRDDGSWYDTFRDRLMFPITNESGKVIAFGGRAIEAGDEPKYLNSPGTPIYQKSQVLYNLHRARAGARRTSRVVLVEGYMDVIGAYAAGVPEALAPCGTALTSAQARTLRRMAPLAVVNFVPDNAGANATERSLELLLDEGLRIRVATLPGGLDPDEFVRANGAEAYRGRLETAAGYFTWLAGRARQKFPVATSEGKVQALESLLPQVRRVGDPVERAALAGEIAATLGIDHGLLLEQFRRAATSRSQERLSIPRTDLPPAEKLLLSLVLHSAAVREEVFHALDGLPHLESSTAGEIWTALRSLPDAASFAWEDLAGKLSESARTLMTAMAFADPLLTEENLVEQARACVTRLAAGARETRLAELKRRVIEAEKRGALTEALEYAQEMSRISRES